MARIGYTIKQAAETVGVPQHVIESAIHDGHLDAKKIENKAVVPAAAIVRWLDAQPSYVSRQA